MEPLFHDLHVLAVMKVPDYAFQDLLPGLAVLWHRVSRTGLIGSGWRFFAIAAQTGWRLPAGISWFCRHFFAGFFPDLGSNIREKLIDRQSTDGRHLAECSHLTDGLP